MATIKIAFPSEESAGKIIKWRVSSGTMVSAGRILLLYQNVDTKNADEKKIEKKLRASEFGKVTELLAKQGDIVQPGQLILSMTGCKHPTVMKDLCAECGADLREEVVDNDGKKGNISEASVPMLHSIPELKVCPELAEKIGKEDELRLLQDRKLALLVDLDQTIVHTTNDNVPAVMTDVFHFQLGGPHSPWYHTRLRPGTRHFLSEMSKMYELHICTFGARNYAHTIAAYLDEEKTLFSHRILSRDECFNPILKTANLTALFPCGDDLVCIIDDREDVWQGCGNLVQVKPYNFFRHTGDINAPPGFDKDDPSKKSIKTETKERNKVSKDDDSIVSNENGVTEVESDLKILEVGPKSEETLERPVDTINVIEKLTVETEKEETLDQAEGKGGITSGTEVKLADDSTSNEEKSEVQEDSKVESKEAEKEKLKIESHETDSKEKLVQNKSEKKKEETVEYDDHDDYLLYLEDILRRIHIEFYQQIDKKDRKPLREIIPNVRARVLKGLHLTFSGLIPTHQKLNQSRAYKVARAFGAEVSEDLNENTTHLVAIQPGTAKVNSARKNKKVKIVNSDWLWSCAERWELVDERLFQLTATVRGSRIPPPHCSSPERVEVAGKEVSDTFASSINPLMSFTQEEIDNMDKEVEEDMTDPEMESSIMDADDLLPKREANDSDNSSDSYDHVFRVSKKRRKIENENSSDDQDYNLADDDDDDDNENTDKNDEYGDGEDDDDEDEDPMTRFRRGGNLPDDLDLGENSQQSVEIDDPIEEDDDREWNAMGAALEREFLSD